MTDEPDDVKLDAQSANSPRDEGEIAADYIEELLDLADLDGDIDIDVHDGRTYISVSADEGAGRLSQLSEHRAALALQELTRLAVQQETGERTRLVLDIQGSRERRRQELADRVAEARERLAAGDALVEFEPMSSYERKLVHDLAREQGLDSTSEGENRSRHIVLSLLDDAGDLDEDAGDDADQ